MSDKPRLKSSRIAWLINSSRGTVRLHLVAIGLGVLSAALSTSEPLLMRALIDDTLRGTSSRALIYIPVLFTSVAIGRHFLQCTSSQLTLAAVLRGMLQVKQRLLARLLKTSPLYVSCIRPGELLYRLERDVEQVASIAGELLSMLVQTAVVIAMISATMVELDWKLAALVLPLVPCALTLRWHFRDSLESSTRDVLDKSQDLSGFLEEQLSALQQLQLLGAEIKSVRGLVRRSVEVVRAQIKRRQIETRFHLSTISIAAIGSGFILGFGSRQVHAGVTTIGTLVAFYGYLTRMLDPLAMAVDAYAHVQRMFASIDRLRGMEAAGPALDRPQPIRRLDGAARGVIELENVRFQFHPEREVLRGVNMKICPGSSVALIGSSGSGKSTLARLMVRLYQPMAGNIRLDGIDLAELGFSGVRGSVVLMPQDPILFRLTIRENLLLAKPDATRQQMDAALDMTMCSELIARLPRGIDSEIGPRGCQLASGERQRLSLARLVLREPSAVILDEATSALDGNTEREILTNLSGFLANRSVLLISHRVAPVAWAKTVSVLDDGIIALEGKHDSLRTNPSYQRLLGEISRSGKPESLVSHI